MKTTLVRESRVIRKSHTGRVTAEAENVGMLEPQGGSSKTQQIPSPQALEGFDAPGTFVLDLWTPVIAVVLS